MSLDVAKVTEEPLPRPRGAAYTFAWDLVESCAAWGEGHALNFYYLTDLQLLAAGYIMEHLLDVHESKTIFDWVESLPYDDADYISLYFNW